MEENSKCKTKILSKIVLCFTLLLVTILLQNTTFATEGEEYKYLSDEDINPISKKIGYGDLLKDKTSANGKISVKIEGAYYEFERGLWAHAASNLVYDLTDYDYDYFTAYIGLNRTAASSSNGVIFRIYTSTDGNNWNLKYNENSVVSKPGEDAKFVKIDIKTEKFLKLEADSNGSNGNDHSVYADAKLIKEIYKEPGEELVPDITKLEQRIKEFEGQELTQGSEYEHILLKREFINRVGNYALRKFLSDSAENRTMYEWLTEDVDNLRLYVMGGIPGGGNYYDSLTILSKLYEEYSDDFNNTTLLGNPTYTDMTYGELYKKMAMSIALTHTQTVGLWMQSGLEENKSEPLRRYAIFKYIHKNGWMKFADSMDMTHLFEDLHIVEMRTVLANNIDDEEILWLNRYVQDNVDKNPGNVWRYQTPHPYIAYVWPNYANPVYFDPDNIDYFNELFAINKTADNSGKELGGENTGKVGIFDSEFTIPGGKNIQTYTLKVSRGTPEYKLCKVWMNFRNKFGTGCVCGGISKSGVNIRGTHGIPSRVIGQPGHAAILFYSKDAEGRGFWRIDNDVSGWAFSGGGGTLLGWGNSYTQGFYNGVYIELEQAAVNDYQNLIKAEEQVMLAKVYDRDLKNEITRKAALEKQEEIYEKALEIQNINFDAWLGLIAVYNANEDKTEEECYKLVEKIAENLQYFPLPMYNATSLVQTKLTSAEKKYEFTLLQTRTLIQASQLPNNTEDSFTVMQPGVTRIEANYLLNNVDTTIAKFSFDGEDAGKIVLSTRFDGSGVRWDYSLDGKQTWNEVSFTAEEEHKLQLTQEQVDSITSENDIYVHIVGVNYNEENIYIIDILDQELPDKLYNNDWENKVIGATEEMEWKMEGNSNWTKFSDVEPDLTGNKNIIVRAGKRGVYLESQEKTFSFTTDTNTPERKYIPIANLSIHGYSTQSVDKKRPYYAQNAIDGNIHTEWHTDFSKSIEGTEAYIAIKLNEPKYISALEYLHMNNDKEVYGYMKTGIVYVSSDGEEWKEVARIEDCEANDEIKSITFNESVYGQYVKLVIESHDNIFATAAIINLYEDTTKQDNPDDPDNPDNPKDFIFTSDKYKIEENYVSKISPNTNITKFKENVETNQELSFKGKDGNNLVEDGIITTGSKVQVGNKEYTLIVIGDIDQNGKISVTDLAQLKLHYIKKETLTDIRLKAADVNGDGKVSITDLAQIKLVLIKLMEI